MAEKIIIDFESKRDPRYRLQHRAYDSVQERREAIERLTEQGHIILTDYLDAAGPAIQMNYLQVEPQTVWDSYTITSNPYGLVVNLDEGDVFQRSAQKMEIYRMALLVGIPVESVWDGEHNGVGHGAIILRTVTHEKLLEIHNAERRARNIAWRAKFYPSL